MFSPHSLERKPSNDNDNVTLSATTPPFHFTMDNGYIPSTNTALFVVSYGVLWLKAFLTGG
ncbi:hypothetical protein D9758_017684 [Tetrapyrgos nigripes]|uniref:Uncharacterized protein n=1 Tax=Tetrapyrgos nigripes TaxID=182062 RepID=A0A8H5C640_9AGAR|nr:hypothetical protein D9758_017684 [Tetrapyrgos nigripes]